MIAASYPEISLKNPKNGIFEVFEDYLMIGGSYQNLVSPFLPAALPLGLRMIGVVLLVVLVLLVLL